jgi:lipopolysaccharide transport system permease protein
MSVFYVVFGILLGSKTDDFVAYLLVGLTCWQWLKSCLTHGGQTILTGHVLMKQVHLPKIIFPVILILTDTVKFIFVFLLLLAFLWVYGYPPNFYYIMLPIVLLIQLLFILGFTLLLAAIVPFLPDLRFVVENLLQAVFFISGIVFSTEIIPEKYIDYFYLNPIASLVKAYRDILLYQQAPDAYLLLFITLISCVALAASIAIIKHFEYHYPKVMA